MQQIGQWQSLALCLPIMLCWVPRCKETKFLCAVCMCFIQCCLLQEVVTEYVCAIGVQWGFNAVGGMTPYVAGLLQLGKIYGKETSFVGHYYMLNKVFVAAGTPQGSFDSGMAVMLDKSSEEVLGMYLVCLYHGETLQWHFKVTGQRATPLPTAYHNDISCYEDGRREYCSKCFCLLLLIPESGHAILPSQLTGISSLAQVVFEANKSMGSVACCLRWVTPPVLCL